MAKKIVPVSDKTLKGMSLNIDDRAFIKRSLDAHNEDWNKAFDKNIVELTKALAEVIQQQNERMFLSLEKQNKLITEIRNDVICIKERLKLLEQRQDTQDLRLRVLEIYAGWPSTIIRVLIAAIIGVLIALGLHSLIR
jgi:hypothetical protein